VDQESRLARKETAESIFQRYEEAKVNAALEGEQGSLEM
jgi:hypothetical protein